MVIKLFSCSTQQSMEFIMLINIFKNANNCTFISLINITSESLKARKDYF